MCGDGADQGFSYNLGPGEEIRIGLSSSWKWNTQQTLRYGGVYPGDWVVQRGEGGCQYLSSIDLSHTNTAEVEATVYFVIAGYSSSDAGDFVLAWEIEVPGMPRTLSNVLLKRYSI